MYDMYDEMFESSRKLISDTVNAKCISFKLTIGIMYLDALQDINRSYNGLKK